LFLTAGSSILHHYSLKERYTAGDKTAKLRRIFKPLGEIEHQLFQITFQAELG
jgi:hypothetical protein